MKKINYLLIPIALLEMLFFIILGNGQFTVSLALVLLIILFLFIVNKIKNNNIIEFLLLITLITTLCFMPYLTKHNVFLFISDQATQYDMYGTEWKRLLTNFIKNGSFPFYSFNSFLGNNFIASKSFYITGDPFFLIVMLFESINEGYLFEMYLMMVLAGLFMYLYLNEFGIKNKKIIVVVSLLYVFGGTTASVVYQYFWKIFLTYLPLFLLSIEIYRKKGKLALFIITVALCLLSQSYSMFSTTLFLVPYFIFTYYYHDENINLVNILKKSINPIVCYFVGFLISGIILIPTMLYMMGNERVGSGLSADLFYPFRVYVNYIYSMIIMTFANKYTNYFATSEKASYHLWGFSIYNGMLIAPVIFSSFFFKNRSRKERIMNIFVIFISVITLIPITSSIMHGFSGASMKWTYLTAFVYLLLFATFFDSDNFKLSILKKGLLAYVSVFTIVTILAIVLNILPLKSDNVQLINALICVVILIGYYLLLKSNKKKLVLLLCCIEVIYSFNLLLATANTEFGFHEDSLDRNVFNYINDMDDDKFYRNNIDGEKIAPFIKTLNLNQSLNYGYKSATCYDSTYEPNLNEFLKMNGIDWHIIKITNPEVLRMLGVKYYYVQNESELPKDFDFTYITDSYNWHIYKLNNYRPLGFTYSKFTTSSEEITSNNSWNNVLLIDNNLHEQTKDIKESNSIDFKITEYYDDNNIKGNISVDNKQILFLSIPYSDGWRVKDNGIPVTTYKVQGGFIGIVLEPGEHYIELSFTPPGFKIGCISTLIGICGFFIIILFVDKKKTIIDASEINGTK